jgi:hypothetical protein
MKVVRNDEHWWYRWPRSRGNLPVLKDVTWVPLRQLATPDTRPSSATVFQSYSVVPDKNMYSLVQFLLLSQSISQLRSISEWQVHDHSYWNRDSTHHLRSDASTQTRSTAEMSTVFEHTTVESTIAATMAATIKTWRIATARVCLNAHPLTPFSSETGFRNYRIGFLLLRWSTINSCTLERKWPFRTKRNFSQWFLFFWWVHCLLIQGLAKTQSTTSDI